jgi:hypothetical protein
LANADKPNLDAVVEQISTIDGTEAHWNELIRNPICLGFDVHEVSGSTKGDKLIMPMLADVSDPSPCRRQSIVLGNHGSTEQPCQRDAEPVSPGILDGLISEID